MLGTKIETTWEEIKFKRMPWNAIFKCAEEYKKNNPSHNDSDYREFMLEEYGINHSESVRVVNESKYMMFLLRWA